MAPGGASIGAGCWMAAGKPRFHTMLRDAVERREGYAFTKKIDSWRGILTFPIFELNHQQS